jgi:ferredoxin
MTTGSSGSRLRVNPIACKAHGVCIELLPELIGTDPWGYPVVSGHPVPDRLMDHAKRAVEACPTIALLLEAIPPTPTPGKS